MHMDYTPEFVLREATESDRTYLRRLNFLADVFGDEHGEVGDDELEGAETYVGQWDPKKDSGIVAFDQYDVPAGGVWLRYWGSSDGGHAKLGDDIPEIAIAVENRYAGNKLAVKLLTAAVELAKQQGAPKVALWVDPNNDRARHRYESFGFKNVDGHDNVMAVDVDDFTA
mgnify:CR=1 FL=1